MTQSSEALREITSAWKFASASAEKNAMISVALRFQPASGGWDRRSRRGSGARHANPDAGGPIANRVLVVALALMV